MNKGIGFSRTITLDWLDVTASLCTQNVGALSMRQRLEETISDTVTGIDAQRKTIDVLIAIWVKTEKSVPQIRREALMLFPTLPLEEERLWLHYGMTLVTYPFFRKCVSAIGQVGRTEDFINRKMIKNKIAGDYGHLGALDRSAERVMASLKNWNVLSDGDEKNVYRIRNGAIREHGNKLQTWILNCALQSHPLGALPFDDLIGLPELFPFHFTITIDELMQDTRFSIHRQGGGLDMIELNQEYGIITNI